MNIDLSDDEISKEDTKEQWFQVHSQSTSKFHFDGNTQYTFHHYAQRLKTVDACHIVIPIYQPDEDKYKKIIFGDVAPPPNIFFNQFPTTQKAKVILHVVFLGDSFLEAVKERRTDVFQKNLQQQIENIIQMQDSKYSQQALVRSAPQATAPKGESDYAKMMIQKNMETEKMIQQVRDRIESEKEQERKEIDEIKQSQREAMTTTTETVEKSQNQIPWTEHLGKFINYDFAIIEKDNKRINFPFAMCQTIKGLFAYRDKNVEIYQYDMQGINYVKHLEQHLGFI